MICAEGDNSGTGVIVLPSGLNPDDSTSTPELATGASTVTIETIRDYLLILSPTLSTLLVEKLIPGSGSGATATLPNDHKFHIFNGEIGLISTFLDCGTDWACFGEYSKDWDHLHKNGCFIPNMPMGVVSPENTQC